MRPFFSQKRVLLLLHLLTFWVFVVCQRWPIKKPDFTCQAAKLHTLSLHFTLPMKEFYFAMQNNCQNIWKFEKNVVSLHSK